MSAIAAPLGSLSGLIADSESTGQSDSARSISRMQEEIRTHLLKSHAIGSRAEQALNRLEELRQEASSAGWDGYGGKPVNPLAYLYARSFLTALPTTAPTPELGADADGEIAFDWFFGDRKALSVSIGPTGRCTFAWMNGHTTSRGTDWIENDVPASIVFALAQLARAATSR